MTISLNNQKETFVGGLSYPIQTALHSLVLKFPEPRPLAALFQRLIPGQGTLQAQLSLELQLSNDFSAYCSWNKSQNFRHAIVSIIEEADDV